MKLRGLTAVMVVSFASLLHAQTPKESEVDLSEQIATIDKTLHYQTGDVNVGSGLAVLHLGKDYRFLNPADAKKVIVDIWGNPPSQAEHVLGMITAGTQSPVDPESWGVVVTHVDEGHIDDADAKKIDYSAMLTEMQKECDAGNADRKKAGFDAMHLVGWAQTPSYDEGSKKLIWAKEYSSDKAREHSLNYDVRVLGRTGAMSLNAVGRPGQLSELEGVMVDVAQRAEFVSGQKYADYQKGTDRLAEYGVAALIGGGIAAKAGLFKGLIIAVLALKKFVIVGVVAVIAFIKKLFGKGTPKTAPLSTGDTMPPPPLPPTT